MEKQLYEGRMVEIKVCPAEFKVNDSEGTVEGYASVFGNKDTYGDIVDKGAFKKTIKESNSRIKVMWQHRDPIGVPIAISEDDHGLLTKSRITLTEENKDRLMLIRDGVVNEMSIGFDTLKFKIDEEEEEGRTRHLTEVRLWEYSIVTWGANNQAAVTSIKSEEEIEAILFKLNNILLRETKEGRVLSGKNKKLVVDAIEALQVLLKATEPSEDTSPDGEPPKDGNEPTDMKSLVDGILEPLESLQFDIMSKKMLDDLREFGKLMGGK